MGKKTAGEMMGEMNQAQSMAPAELQLGAAKVGQGAINEARNRYFNDYARPGIEQLKADLAAEGRDTSTFGAAALAQADQEARRQAYYAGEDLVDRALQRWKTKRDSYFGTRGGEGGLASNDKGGADMAQSLIGAANARTNWANAWWDANRQYGTLADKSDWAARRAGVGAFQTLMPYATNAIGSVWNGAKQMFGFGGGGGGGGGNGGGGGYASTYSSSPFGPTAFAPQGGWKF